MRHILKLLMNRRIQGSMFKVSHAVLFKSCIMYIYIEDHRNKSNEIHDPCDDAGIVGDDRVRWSVPAQGKLEYLWLLSMAGTRLKSPRRKRLHSGRKQITAMQQEALNVIHACQLKK